MLPSSHALFLFPRWLLLYGCKSIANVKTSNKVQKRKWSLMINFSKVLENTNSRIYQSVNGHPGSTVTGIYLITHATP